MRDVALERMHRGCGRFLVDENEVGYSCGTNGRDPCDDCVNKYLVAIGEPPMGAAS